MNVGIKSPPGGDPLHVFYIYLKWLCWVFYVKITIQSKTLYKEKYSSFLKEEKTNTTNLNVTFDPHNSTLHALI